MRKQFQRISVKIEDIELDLHNPRYHHFENEKECIEFMFDDDGTKMKKIVSDIIEFGLMESPILITDSPNEGKYTVKDGNRRIAAMKALLNPSTVQAKYSKWLKNLTLADDIKTEIENIECHYSKDIEAINANIERMHQGEFDGKGVNSWEAIQQYYFMKNNNKAGQHYLNKTMIFIESAGYNEEEIYAIDNITTINRILSSQFEKVVGVTIENDRINYDNTDKKVVTNLIKQVVSEVSDKIINVTDVEKSGAIEKYLKDKMVQLTAGSIIDGLPGGIVTNPPSAPGSNPPPNIPPVTPPSHPKPTKPSYDRKYMIEKKDTLDTTLPKLNDIQIELSKQLNVNNTPNAAGVMLRVLLELSVDEYIKKHPGTFSSKDGKNVTMSKSSALKEKLMYCANHLLSARKIDKKEAGTINDLATNKQNHLVKDLHAFIHDANYSKAGTELNKTWDNYKFFIKQIWIPKK